MSWRKRAASLVAIGAALERLSSLHPAALAGAGPTRTAGVNTERPHPEIALSRYDGDDADLREQVHRRC